MYHRVCRTSNDPWRLAVRPEHFEQHLALLAREKVVPLTSLACTPGGIAITFDDGYADNLETALPLLEKYKLPATVFVATDALRNREFWWDRVEHSLFESATLPGARRRLRDMFTLQRFRTAALGARLRTQGPEALEKSLSKLPHIRSAAEPACSRHRMMSEDEVRVLAASPLIEIGAHTCSHPCLPQLPEQEQQKEVTASRDILERLTGRRVRTFSYPYGAHDDTTVRVVKRAGFELACIVGGGQLRSSTDPLRMPRLMVRDFGGAAFAQYLRCWKTLRWLA